MFSESAIAQRLLDNPMCAKTYSDKKFTNKKLISKLFVRHSSGDKHWNKGKKKLFDFVIKLNEDDWVFEKSVTTCDQRKSFK